MTIEEELIWLRKEHTVLRERLAQRDELIQQQHTLLVEQNAVIQHHEEQMRSLSEQLKALQDQLGKDSHHSHLPPSSDRFVRKTKSLRTKSGKKSGGQPGHRGSSLQFSSTPDEIIELHVEACDACQQDLHAVAVCGRERRQVVDVPSPRVVVQEYRAEQKRCPHCQQITSAAFPAGVQAPLQYGPHVGATAVYLVEQHLLPLARTCEVLRDLLGVQISEGTVGELITRCARQLAPVERQISEALKQAEVIHQDETGLYVAGRRHWMHVTCTPTLTHYHVDASRGQAALEAIGIVAQFTGVSIHDGWASYFLYDCEHALCIVHLLRDLVFLEEQGLSWAADLKALLLEMKAATDQARALGKTRLDFWEVVDWEAQFLRLLDEGDRLHPRATAPPGQRGRCKQSDARNLLDRLRTQQKAVFCFLEDLRVDFDNNLAERDLRMVKVQQKVSGCFRSLAGAHAFARIRGYLSTLRKQSLPLLSSLQATLVGHPVLPSLEQT
ncbi:MAG TPA: IS66 family transposase [Ktedonosporobacter sp.]|nr:IS66 family transposase [Ktedonosporobacter sp.]